LAIAVPTKRAVARSGLFPPELSPSAVLKQFDNVTITY